MEELKKKNNVLEVIEEKNLKDKDRSIKLCYSGIFCGPIKTVYNLLSKIKKINYIKSFC